MNVEIIGKLIPLCGVIWLWSSAAISIRRGFFQTRYLVLSRRDNPDAFWTRAIAMIAIGVLGLVSGYMPYFSIYLEASNNWGKSPSGLLHPPKFIFTPVLEYNSIMPHVIDISDLPEPLVEAIETMIRSYRERPPQNSASRQPGWAKGQLPELPDSFFEPLPNELLDLFDGKSS